MAKTDRITVRFDPEDTAWLAQQAQDCALDVAAFLRMLVRKARNGTPLMQVEAAAGGLQATIIERDVLDVGSAAVEETQQPAEPSPDVQTAPIDVDALVDAQLAEAEAAGITAPRVDLDPPPAAVGGVRVIQRPPIRYSPAMQPAHILQQ